MRRRDWVLAGAGFTFTAAGVIAWRAIEPSTAGILTALGGMPLLMGGAAWWEFINGPGR